MRRRLLPVAIAVACALMPAVAHAGARIQYEFDSRVPSVEPGRVLIRPQATATYGVFRYVVDSGASRVFKLRSDGTVAASWGTNGSSSSQLRTPTDIAVDSQGNVYVTDAGNNKVVKYNASGSYQTRWTTLGGSGSGNNNLSSPSGIAIDAYDNIYVADTGNNRVVVFDTSGQYQRQFGLIGSTAGKFIGPLGVAVDRLGDNVYVADTGNNRIQRLTGDGAYLGSWGTTGTGVAQFSGVNGVAVDLSGNVYAVDAGNRRIESFTATGTPVASWGSTGTAAGQFVAPTKVCVGTDDTVFVADGTNQRVQFFSAAGAYQGEWGMGTSASGGFETAEGCAVDGTGNIYVADTGNNRVQVLDKSGQFVTAWGSLGTAPGQFNRPAAVAIDTSGSVYVLDTGNSRVQKFASDGTYLTSWGSAGSGPSQFDTPQGISVDASHVVYVADTGNDRVRSFTETGAVIGGWGSTGGGDGQFDGPTGIAVDGSGHVFVSDINNDRVEKFSSAGTYLTQWGVNGGSRGAFSGPEGVAVDQWGDVYVVDGGNNRVEKFNGDGVWMATIGSGRGIGDYEFINPHGIAIDGSGGFWVANTDARNLMHYRIDTTPPITTISPAIIPTGWQSTPFIFTLTATDGMFGTDGLMGIRYRINGDEPLLYTGQVRVERDGITAVEYWASDVEGNVEKPHTIFLWIDQTAPKTTVSIPASGDAVVTGKLSASDAVSGVVQSYWKIDSDTANEGSAITITKPGHHVLSYWSFDLAGNRGEPATKSVDVFAKTTASITASPGVPAYAATTTVSGVVKATGASVGTQTVYLDRSSNGTTWVQAAVGSTNGSGAYAFTVKPTTAIYYRVRMARVSYLMPVTSAKLLVKPQALLTMNTVPATITRSSGVVVSGTLRPQHAAGLKSVAITAEKYVSGKWTLVSTYYATNVSKTGYTYYSLKIVLPSTGTWRLSAVHSDASHAKTVTTPQQLVAK